MKTRIIKFLQAALLVILGVFLLSGCTDYSEYMGSDFDGSKFGDKESFNAIYNTFDMTTITNTIDMNGYGVLSVTIENERGYVDYVISDSVGNVLYTQTGVIKDNRELVIDYPGFVKIDVTGKNAKGRFRFVRKK